MAMACIRKGFDVSITDTDIHASGRFSTLYQERYGEQPPVAIYDELSMADFYVVATPPDTHYDIVKNIRLMNENAVILVEKPLCLPGQVDQIPEVMVNYNHLYSECYQHLLKNHWFIPDRIEVHWRESVYFILKAHPWIKDIYDSYLGHASRGGGSAFEHSHGLAGALGLFKDLGREEITDLRAEKTWVGQYDSAMALRFICRGMKVSVFTDFVSEKPQKSILMAKDENWVKCDFSGKKEDTIQWSRDGTGGSLSYMRGRNDQFLSGLEGALNPTMDTFNIGKLVVQLIGEAHGF